MKKILSISAAICIMLSGIITVFAQDNAKSDIITKQMEGAVAYLTNGVDKYGVDDAVDYYTLVLSGVDLTKYNDDFLKSVKENLEANGGKIVSSYGESLAGYGSVILILDELGEDPTDFYGYDITASFSAMDPTAPQASPYYYRNIIPASFYCDDAFTRALCDTFINDNYVMGKGMGFYGTYFSADSTAYFINALSSYADEYPEIMEDAFTVLETYHTDGGYFSDTVYVTEANTDSTALALMAYSSVFSYIDDDKLDGYFNKLNEIYSELCAFEGSATGIFVSTYTGEDDMYATKEALMGLEEYYYVAWLEEILSDDTGNGEIDNVSDNDINTTISQTKEKDNIKKSPSTCAGTFVIAFPVALSAAGVAVLTAKKRSFDY